MFPALWTNKSGGLSTQGTHPLEQFRREFDVLLDRFFGGALAPSDMEFESMRWWDFHTEDKGNELIVKAELPGFDEKDLDVELSNNVLTIQAEKQQKNGEERRSTSFRRTVTLPTGTNPDKVTASYRNGVLELHIPKTEASRGKRIPVQGQQAVSGPTKEQSQTPPAQGAKKRDS